MPSSFSSLFFYRSFFLSLKFKLAIDNIFILAYHCKVNILLHGVMTKKETKTIYSLIVSKSPFHFAILVTNGMIFSPWINKGSIYGTKEASAIVNVYLNHICEWTEKY